MSETKFNATLRDFNEIPDADSLGRLENYGNRIIRRSKNKGEITGVASGFYILVRVSLKNFISSGYDHINWLFFPITLLLAIAAINETFIYIIAISNSYIHVKLRYMFIDYLSI